MYNYVIVFGALGLSLLLSYLMMKWAGMFKEEDAAFIYFALTIVMFMAMMSFIIGLTYYGW